METVQGEDPPALLGGLGCTGHCLSALAADISPPKTDSDRRVIADSIMALCSAAAHAARQHLLL